MRAQLTDALQAEFHRARQQSQLRLEDAVGPYARFVRAEEARWRAAQETLGTLSDRIATMLARLGDVETE